MGYMPGGNVAGCIVAMHLLVVKKDVGPVGFQEFCFGQPPQKYRFIDAHVPGSQSSDDPLMSRCGARRDQRCANGRVLGGKRLLQSL